MLSFSGEDFFVTDLAGNVQVQIDGANINLGGFVLDFWLTANGDPMAFRCRCRCCCWLLYL